MEHRTDVFEAVEFAAAGSMAGFGSFFPSFGRLEILRPEGKRPALARTHGVDRATPIPENTVAVTTDAEAWRAVERPQIAIAEGVERQLEPSRDALRLGATGIDPTRLRSPAAVVTLLAGEPKAPVVEQQLRHLLGDIIICSPPLRGTFLT